MRTIEGTSGRTKKNDSRERSPKKIEKKNREKKKFDTAEIEGEKRGGNPSGKNNPKNDQMCLTGKAKRTNEALETN